MKKSWLQKLGAGILAFATIASLAFGVYTWVYEKKPIINISITGNFDVLEINRNIENLKILYDGSDLEKDKKKLNVVRIRVENTGDLDVLQGMFDSASQWGLAVKNAKIVKASLTSASSSYLTENIGVSATDNRVTFGKVIFEKKSYFEFELLLLYDRSTVPLFSFYGKIAGVDSESTLVHPFVPRETLGFWEGVFFGSLTVQVLKAIIYFLIVAIVIAILVAAIGFSSEFFSSIARSFRRRKYERLLAEEESKFDSIKSNYVADGISGLRQTYRLLNDKREVRERIIAHKRFSRGRISPTDAEQMELFIPPTEYRFYDPIVRHLMAEKVVQFSKGEVDIDPSYVEELSRVISRLEE